MVLSGPCCPTILIFCKLVFLSFYRSHIEQAVKDGKPLVHKKKEIKSVGDYSKAGIMRALTVEEVGEAFMQSLKRVTKKFNSTLLIQPS